MANTSVVHCNTAMAPQLDRRQLEQLLPDYAFGRLPAEEAQRVEAALQRYPDLAAEVEALRAVFQRLESMPLMQELERRSSILSVLVLNRWKEREAARQHMARLKPLLALLLPVAALLLLTLWRSPQQLPSEHASPEPSALVAAPQPELPPEGYLETPVVLTYALSGIPPAAYPTVSEQMPLLSEEEVYEILTSISASGNGREATP